MVPCHPNQELSTSWRCKVLQPPMEAELVRLEEELEARALAGRTSTKLHVSDWGAEQREDPLLRVVSEWLKDGKAQGLGTYFLKDVATTTAIPAYERVRENFMLSRGIIYLDKMSVGELDSFLVFMVPEGYCRTTLNGCHQNGCHQWKERTLAQVAKRFWWPGMATELHHIMVTCRHCKMFEGRGETASLCPILVSTHWN